MTPIGKVIGWKFNHQSGMSTKGGVITAFPGGIPSQADQDLWTIEYEAFITSEKAKKNLPRVQLEKIVMDRLIEAYMKELDKL